MLTKKLKNILMLFVSGNGEKVGVAHIEKMLLEQINNPDPEIVS